MKNAYVILSLSLGSALWFFSGCTKSTHPQHPIEDRGKDAEDAAKNTLKFLVDVIDPETFAGLGFRSLDEVKSAKLGAPIPVLGLRCDLMTKPDASRNGGVRALSFSNRILYPLVVAGVVRSSFMVDSVPDDSIKSGRNWMVTEIGNAGLARLVDSSLHRHTGISKLPKSTYTVAEIPNLGQAFLVYPSKDGEMVVPMESATASGCTLGSPGQAVTLATALQTFSQCKTLPKSCSM